MSREGASDGVMLTLRPRLQVLRTTDPRSYDALKDMTPRQQAAFIEMTLARVGLLEGLLDKTLSQRAIGAVGTGAGVWVVPDGAIATATTAVNTQPSVTDEPKKPGTETYLDGADLLAKLGGKRFEDMLDAYN